MLTAGCGDARGNTADAEPLDIQSLPHTTAPFDPGSDPGSVLLVPINRQQDNDPNAFDPDDNCFYDNAVRLQRYYADELGAQTTVLSVNTPALLLQELEDLAAADRQFDRVIFLSHASRNGPLFCCGYNPQIGYDYPNAADVMGDENSAYLRAFGEKLARVTHPGGWIYLGGCQTGKSGTSFDGFDRYIDAIACVTNRRTLGTSSLTACWDVGDRVTCLEGRPDDELVQSGRRPECVDDAPTLTFALEVASPGTYPSALGCYADGVTAPRVVEILSPTQNQTVANPVPFRIATSGVAWVKLVADDQWPLTPQLLPAEDIVEYAYAFNGIDTTRTVTAFGYDDHGQQVAEDVVSFIPAAAPSIEIFSPANGATVANPVTFQFETRGPIARVNVIADDKWLLDTVLPSASEFESSTYTFNGTGAPRKISFLGLDGNGEPLISRELWITVQ